MWIANNALCAPNGNLKPAKTSLFFTPVSVSVTGSALSFGIFADAVFGHRPENASSAT